MSYIALRMMGFDPKDILKGALIALIIIAVIYLINC